MRAISVLAVLVASTVAANIPRSPPPAKYNTNAKRVEGKINVHLVPHTHDDVGWLKTVDQYYYGRNNSIQYAAVANILDAVTAELARDPSRKFIYVETEFFWRWWNNRPQYQELTKQLVANGQLEFINGGACMHDEANPSYVDMIDQTTLGHRFLMETFNVTPKAAWQIDPFGHSAFQGAVMSSPLAGFNSVFYARADYEDFALRQQTKSTEFYWAPSPSLGMNQGTLGGILFYYYYPAPGFNWESNDDPVCDDPTLEEYNVQSRVDDFVSVAMTQANGTMGNDLMWTMGTDFSYEQAAFWYQNLDKIIHYVNLDGRVNALYSTPSIYAEAKIGYGKANPLPVKTDDYMPLIDGPHSVWAGFFTSRSALKAYIRETSSYHQAVRQVQVLAGGATDLSPNNPLFLVEHAMGVAQHHDAVTGTSKQHVAYDYAKRLAGARLVADAMLTSSFATLTGDSKATFVTCDLANVTICPALENSATPIIALVYNQQAQPRSDVLMRFPIASLGSGQSYAVYDAAGNPVTAQLVPTTSVDQHLRTEYYSYNSNPTTWLAFVAELPPVGFATFFILPASAEDAEYTFPSQVETLQLGKRFRGEAAQSITNGIVTVSFDTSSGLVTSYAKNGSSFPFTQTFGWYNASAGVQDSDAPQADQASGAYIFRPNSSTVFPVAESAVTVQFVTGPVVQEARQVFSSWLSQIVRVWANSGYADFEWTIGPIPFQDGLGREVISKYSTNWATNGTWWTDSNGRDSMLRLRNKRLSFPINITEPVAANYYPVNTFITLKNPTTNYQLNVMTDRSQGGSSMQDGAVELMVQRRLQYDDNRGVGEPLNETGLDGNGLVVRGIHRVSIDPAATAGRTRRTAVNDLLFRPLTVFSPFDGNVKAWISGYKAQLAGLTAPLPPNVHLLTAHSWGPTQLLLRLSHQYEVGEDAAYSTPVSVSLANLFSGFRITQAIETTITANQPLDNVPKTTYVAANGDTYVQPSVPPAPSGTGLTVTLEPLQIRTFMCTTTQQ